MFTQCTEYRDKFSEMQRLYEDNVRYYKVDEDNNLSYPSITSIISFINKDKFVGWRQRVGNEEADRIMKNASSVGTEMHKVLEFYYNNEKYFNATDFGQLPRKMAEISNERVKKK